jgi:hypothetical protein
MTETSIHINRPKFCYFNLQQIESERNTWNQGKTISVFWLFQLNATLFGLQAYFHVNAFLKLAKYQAKYVKKCSPYGKYRVAIWIEQTNFRNVEVFGQKCKIPLEFSNRILFPVMPKCDIGKNVLKGNVTAQKLYASFQSVDSVWKIIIVWSGHDNFAPWPQNSMNLLPHRYGIKCDVFQDFRKKNSIKCIVFEKV